MKHRPALYGLLGITALVVFTGLTVNGFIKRTGQLPAASFNGQRILGLMSGNPGASSQSGIVDQLATQGKDILSARAADAKDTILANIQKQIAELSKEQIKAVQTQLCTDWGIVPTQSSSSSPSSATDSAEF